MTALPNGTAPIIAPPRNSDRHSRFVAHISRVVADPASRAILRRGFRRTPDQCIGLHRFIAPFGPSNAEAASYYAVASWIAKFGTGTAGLTFGQAARRAARKPGANNSGIEKRLTAAFLCPEPTLVQDRLPALLTLMASHGVVPDMALLLRDVNQWRFQRERIVRIWANDFYSR